TDGMHATRRDDPQAAAQLGPALGLSEQPDKAAEVVVRNHRLRGYKGFPGFVIHVHVSAIVSVTARHFFSVSTAGSRRQTEPPPPGKGGGWSIDCRLRRKMMMPSTTRAKTPATTRISVTLSMFRSFLPSRPPAR